MACTIVIDVIPGAPCSNGTPAAAAGMAIAMSSHASSAVARNRRERAMRCKEDDGGMGISLSLCTRTQQLWSGSRLVDVAAHLTRFAWL